MSAALDHLFVLVRDLEESVRFYRDVVGLEVVHAEPEGGYVRLGGGGGFTMGMERGDPAPGGGGVEIDVLVADVDAWYERAARLGAAVDGPPRDMPWGARHVFLRDPTGNPLSVFSRA